MPRFENHWRLSLLIAMILLVSRAVFAAPEISDADCLECHSDKSLTTKRPDGKEESIFVDASLLKASVHKGVKCAECHADIVKEHPDDGARPKPVGCVHCHERQATSYAESIHGIEAKNGNELSPGCVDCHGSHDALPHTQPQSPLHFSNLAKTCGNCHQEESEDVEASIHGKAAAKGEREAATCLDCHNEHRIEKLKGASAYKISVQICSKCHASTQINAKFQMPANRVETFLGSYHGLAALGRSTLAANCASCHGYHRILPSKDPASTIHPNHLVETCGKCHPGATGNFALSRVHTDDISGKDIGATANRLVRRIYLALIIGVVGLLSFHNLMSWLRSAKEARRARGELVVRMNKGQRIQHFILVASFVLLALTGFALKYPDSWLAWMFGSDENIRRWLHRISGVVLIGLGFFHIVYLVATREGRRLVWDFLPGMRDLHDFFASIRYFVGHSKDKPKFARFGYAEKIEYWAVAWGIVIMGGTGLMIWLKMDVTRYLPRWVVEVAVTIHYYEAILACLAIIVWHFYHVIFAPDVYPMNWAWWDGKVSADWQREMHGLEKTSASDTEPKASATGDEFKSGGEGI